MSDTETHKAIVLHSYDTPLTVQNVATPTPTSGQVLIKVLSAPVPGAQRNLVTGKTGYPMVFPCVPGTSAIGRVEELGPDATSLTPGQLVWVDGTIRARDDIGGAQGTITLLGVLAFSNRAAKGLSENIWRNGSMAERMLAPIENAHPIDEAAVIGKRGYSFGQLTMLQSMCIPYGGWAAGNLRPGETVILCFATGYYGSAAVDVALAMGAGRVVAVGRNMEGLKKIQERHGDDKVSVVALTNLPDEDAKNLRAATPRGEGADCFLDMSPAAAADTASNHIQASISALKAGGRALFMGGIQGTVSIPYFDVMLRNIKIIGKFMFDQPAPSEVIRLVETGRLHLDRFNVDEFALEEIELAIDKASACAGTSNVITLRPCI